MLAHRKTDILVWVGFPYQNRWFFEKFQGGVGVIRLSKTYIANFLLYWGYIWLWNSAKTSMCPQKTAIFVAKNRVWDRLKLCQKFGCFGKFRLPLTCWCQYIHQIFVLKQKLYLPHFGETASDPSRLSSHLCYGARQCTAPQAVCSANVTPYYVCRNIAPPPKILVESDLSPCEVN